ncbi:hypothetical protein ACKRLN_08945 (plasmid) [Anaerococcus sp. DFU013_CI05]|uniref:hypothetical protein n=1 Tax=Anaerococcus sp. AH8042_DFU013_CI05 TaxID=3385202 RepID=UPI003A5221C5
MEATNKIDIQKIKNIEEIFKLIKKESGYDLENISDFSDFVFDANMLEFNKKNNKIKVEKRIKLLKEKLRNEEVRNETKFKNYLMIEEVFKDYGLTLTRDDFNYILKAAGYRAKDSYSIHLYEQLNKDLDSNMTQMCNTISFYENETRERIKNDLEEEGIFYKKMV